MPALAAKVAELEALVATLLPLVDQVSTLQGQVQLGRTLTLATKDTVDIGEQVRRWMLRLFAYGGLVDTDDARGMLVQRVASSHACSDFGPFGDLQRVNVDPKRSDRALQLRIATRELNRP